MFIERWGHSPCHSPITAFSAVESGTTHPSLPSHLQLHLSSWCSNCSASLSHWLARYLHIIATLAVVHKAGGPLGALCPPVSCGMAEGRASVYHLQPTWVVWSWVGLCVSSTHLSCCVALWQVGLWVFYPSLLRVPWEQPGVCVSSVCLCHLS